MSTHRLRRPLVAPLLGALLLATLVAAGPSAPAADAATLGTACQTSGTWVQGELNVYFLDVEQGDAQLLVGPTGRTMLLDLGENVWNRTSDTNAQKVAATIRAICDVPTGPVHLDYVLASHHHLDHIGYAGNPHDSFAYGNGIYELLDPAQIGFTVGTLVDRDGGTWVDSNGDGDCEVGTTASPSPDVVFHNAGTSSSTARRWICWLYGPDGQPDRANIEGRVLTLTNSMTSWPSFDLGPGVNAQVLQANARGVLQADGVTPVSGDRTQDAVPPSENDYSVAVLFEYGDYRYATAGDTDGEYSTSSFGYSYNDVELPLADDFGDVDTMRVNHHGSSHSSSTYYVDTLAPETSVIQCGNNSYGHPAANVMDNLRNVVTTDGTVGTDIYMQNNPCDPDVGTIADAFNSDGDIHLVTTGGGAGYEVRYDVGTNTYAVPQAPVGDAADLVLNEVVADPATFTGEYVELYNPTGLEVDASGLLVDDVAGGGGSPQVVPSGATVPAGGHYVLEVSGSLLNNAGDDVRLLAADGATVIDSFTYTSSADDLAWFRDGDGGAWCPDDGPASKGQPNPSCDGSTPPPPGGVSDLVVNEFVADNATFANEWVELFNPTGSDVDASGLLVDDVAGGGGSPQALPSGAVVPAGGHYVFEVSGYLLNNGGDDVRLLSADGATVIDAFTYTSSADDEVWFRDGDGGAWCPALGAATKGTANTSCDGTAPAPDGTVDDLVVNEFVADNATYANEWVELYNPTGTDVDASGLFIDDVAGGGGSPQAIPSGSVVPAGGHLVVDLSGYLLNNGGDDVRLLSADQTVVIDAFTYGSSGDDLAWYRAPDGGTWCGQAGTATPAASNPSSC